MSGVHDTIALIIAEDGAVRDSLAVLLEAYGLTVRAYERIAGYLHERATAHDCRVLVTYQTTSALGLGIVRELRNRLALLPVVILAAKVDPASAAQAEQLGATIIEAPSEPGALPRAIEAALQTSSGTAR